MNLAENKGGKNIAWSFIRCFFRSFLVGSGFNNRGLQNIGFCYAMQPGLEAIYSDPKELSRAKKRYVRHYNSHPFWAPLLIGVFLSTELNIKSGRFPEQMFDRFKNTTSNSLSAIGDSLFAGSALIFWSLATICLLLTGNNLVAVLLGITLFTCLQVFKVYTFWAGVNKGLSVLDSLRGWDLINWGQKLKYCNTLLVLYLWFLVWPRPIVWYQWYGGAAALGVLGWLINSRKISRELVAVLFFVIWIFMSGIYQQ
ncbi:PTS system mannose/fructose/sorbose family transporter subunit IID [Maridesulfovibrio bastinii]|uniref:PTS system mannose/fructose/sorbose family transporter subunit IID n=1 Tax=Maridesulfovibrio bastinii TaxID=47157 RepID=UPI002480076D|nr:PTS system mannose/fructose/sorbose family transporter subunit IID [Maridesulfovibrio bastinii]